MIFASSNSCCLFGKHATGIAIIPIISLALQHQQQLYRFGSLKLRQQCRFCDGWRSSVPVLVPVQWGSESLKMNDLDPQPSDWLDYSKRIHYFPPQWQHQKLHNKMCSYVASFFAYSSLPQFSCQHAYIDCHSDWRRIEQRRHQHARINQSTERHRQPVNLRFERCP